jgi:hypothetical protein
MTPANPPAGSYPLAVAFSLPSRVVKHGNADVHIVPSVDSELILSVPGAVRHDLRYSLSSPHISFGGPVQLRLTATNDGTVYELANGLKAGPVQFPGMLLLNGGRKSETASWSPGSLCLPCTVHLDGASASVYVVPVWQLAFIVIFLAALTGLVLIARRRTRHLAGMRHRAARS